MPNPCSWDKAECGSWISGWLNAMSAAEGSPVEEINPRSSATTKDWLSASIYSLPLFAQVSSAFDTTITDSAGGDPDFTLTAEKSWAALKVLI